MPAVHLCLARCDCLSSVTLRQNSICFVTILDILTDSVRFMVSLLVQLMAYLSQSLFVCLETLLCRCCCCCCCCFISLAVDMFFLLSIWSKGAWMSTVMDDIYVRENQRGARHLHCKCTLKRYSSTKTIEREKEF